MMHPRAVIGQSLGGDVLEVGPGSTPFPVSPDARVRYADKSIEGGRDTNFPELVGAPWGPKAHFNADMDVSGLSEIASESLDVVVACHMIEHVANPLAALTEFQRVLRPGGRLVLVVPDRTRTFDRVRRPSSFDHLLSEFRSNTKEVSVEHIVEFCDAIYMQPPIHPGLVREWHNPKRLTPERLALHRRRSIHVHCWTPEEFASMLAGAVDEGLTSWGLESIYFCEDVTGAASIEFGMVLSKPSVPTFGHDGVVRLIEEWVRLALEKPHLAPARLAYFRKTLSRDFRKRLSRRAAIAVVDAGRATAKTSRRAPTLDPSTMPRLRCQAIRLVSGLPLIRRAVNAGTFP